MTLFRLVIVAFYLIRCPVAAYHVTATALELARLNATSGVTTYATEPSRKHPTLAKNSPQNPRCLPSESIKLYLVSSAERIGIADVAKSRSSEARQVPARSPPSVHPAI